MVGATRAGLSSTWVPAAFALGERLLRDLGRDEAAIRREGERIRREFAEEG